MLLRAKQSSERSFRIHSASEQTAHRVPRHRSTQALAGGQMAASRAADGSVVPSRAPCTRVLRGLLPDAPHIRHEGVGLHR